MLICGPATRVSVRHATPNSPAGATQTKTRASIGPLHGNHIPQTADRSPSTPTRGLDGRDRGDGPQRCGPACLAAPGRDPQHRGAAASAIRPRRDHRAASPQRRVLPRHVGFYPAIVDAGCRALNTLMAMPDGLPSITRREYPRTGIWRPRGFRPASSEPASGQWTRRSRVSPPARQRPAQTASDAPSARLSASSRRCNCCKTRRTAGTLPAGWPGWPVIRGTSVNTWPACRCARCPDPVAAPGLPRQRRIPDLVPDQACVSRHAPASPDASRCDAATTRRDR